MAKTLLLADDSVTIQKVVNISFASEDVTLVTVDNGDDAVERAKETRPDLILADVVMPGKSGYEVCEAIKADPELCHIPVLLLSGTFEAFDEERAARAGAAGHVAKPFEAQTLVDQVNELLAAAPPAAPEPAPISPPEAVTVAVPADSPDAAADPEDAGFDFFEEDLSAGTPAPAMELGDDDSAFSFGEEELTPEGSIPSIEAPARELPGTPPLAAPDFGAAEEPFADRTSLLVDDAPPLSPEAPEVPPTALSEEALSDTGSGSLSASASELEDSFLTGDSLAASDESFDFSFERESTAPESISIGEPIDSPDDIAEAAVFDTQAAEELAAFEPAVVEPEPGPVEPPPDATHLIDLAAMPEEPTPDPEPIAAPSAPEDAFADAPVELDVPVAVPGPTAEPEPVQRALPDDSAARAEAVLAEISPKLGEAVHDTLEKIAWESFGEATEKIVREVVDRVEQIAWEVIPQLTETLVKAEIQRMKGEDSD